MYNSEKLKKIIFETLSILIFKAIYMYILVKNIYSINTYLSSQVVKSYCTVFDFVLYKVNVVY